MRRKVVAVMLVVGCMLIGGCSQNKESTNKPVVSAELKATQEAEIQRPAETQKSKVQMQLKEQEGEKQGQFLDYTKNEDGTFSTNKYTYKYKIKLTGTLPNAECSSWYTVLTNNKNVTFEKVSWSMLSSQSSDWLDEKETVIVAMGVND
ncbi:MAG: hypothetical protein Q4G58_05980 [bacterium]|nr:hypothetical protein [bacterium]